MRIGKKLLSGFLVLAAMGALVGMIGSINTQVMNSRSQDAYEQGVLPLQIIAKITDTFLNMQLSVRDMYLNGSDGSAAAAGTIRQLRGNLDKLFEEYQPSLVTDEDKQAFDDFVKLYRENYLANLDKMILLVSGRKMDEATTLLNSQISPTAGRLSIRLTKMVTAEQKSIKEMTDENQAVGGTANLLMISLSALSVALSLVIGLLLSRSISRPLGSTVAFARHVSDGDLTVSASDKGSRRKDEIGDLLRAMEQMSLGLKDNIRAVRDTSRDLDDRTKVAVEQMKQTASDITTIMGNVEGINQLVQGQSQSVGQASATAIEIVANLDKLNNLIEDQAANVTESSASIEQMISNIESVMKNIDQMGKAFSTLESVSGDGQNKLRSMIGVVREVAAQSNRLQEANTIIKSIAAKTNLLAMNAAIEAAHAGDKGKGFAVVADEIRKLAELSAGQSKEISGDIKEIQNKINSVSGASEVAEASFASIMEQIAILGRFESEIRNAMREQIEGSRQVLEATTEINDITVRVRSGSSEMLSGSRAIGDMMQGLLRSSQDIKTGMEGVIEGSAAMKASLAQVQTTIVVNEETAATLMREMERFLIEHREGGGDAATAAGEENTPA